MTLSLTGETAADRQRARDEIIGTKAADFKEFAARLGALKEKGSVVVFGSQAALEQANESLPADAKLHVEPAIRHL